jgi:hypothetical protein
MTLWNQFHGIAEEEPMQEASAKIHHSLKKMPVAARRDQIPQWPSYTGDSQARHRYRAGRRNGS